MFKVTICASNVAILPVKVATCAVKSVTSSFNPEIVVVLAVLVAVNAVFSEDNVVFDVVNDDTSACKVSTVVVKVVT